MEKLQMCRICLVKNVRMYAVVNKYLHQLYEKLTDIPFVTEDNRPILACFFCCAKLKQCWRFQRKCLEAEELFNQMMNEGCEKDPLINKGLLSFYNSFTKMPVYKINIFDACQTESDVIIIKEELPDVSENLDDIIEHKEEHQTNESGLDDVDNSYPDVEATPILHAKSDSDEVSLLELKTEVVVEPLESPVAKNPILDRNKSIPRDTITVDHIKNENYPQLLSVSKIETAQYHTNNHNNTALDTSSRNKSHKNDMKCQISDKSIDNDKTVQCGICQKILKRKRFLKYHMFIHSGEKPFKCDICQRTFNRKDLLQSHKRDHARKGPFECDICQKSFDKIRYLKTHIRLHAFGKTHKCNVCQQSFSQKCEIVTHMRIHTGEKPFKCDICQKGFRQIGNLTQHTRVHTGEKPFNCEICQRSFTQKSNLLHHIRSHTGEKPYKCDKCQKGFSKKVTLTKHTCRRPFVMDLETEVEGENHK